MLKKLMLVAASLTLAGCGGYEAIKSGVDGSHSEMVAKNAALQPQIIANAKKTPLIRHADTSWVASRSVQHDTGSGLPPQFDNVTMTFSGRHNIASVAEIIQRTSGIKVMIHPDVQVSVRQLAPVAGGSSTHTGSTTVSGSPGSITSPMNSGQNYGQSVMQGRGNSDYFVEVPVSYRGPLAGFLDGITSRLGLDWEYKEGRIEIRRFVTRTFTITALPGKTDFKTALGKAGGISTGNTSSSTASAGATSTGSFSAQMEVSSQSSIDYWGSVEGSIKTMLSNMGKIAINQGSGTITITDISDVINRVGRFIEEENRILTRQVAFEVQVFTARSNNESEFGVDWNLVYQKLSQLSPQWGLSMVSPGSLASTLASSTGIQILKTATNDNGITDRITGSEAYIKALASVAKVARVTSQRAVTLNRQAVPVAVTDQTSYLAETTPGIASATGGVAGVGLKPGVVTTGFMMNLMPTVTERNSLVLTLTLDMSELRRMSSFSVGTGETQQSIQLPEVSSTQFVQRVGLRTGETLVVTGFEKISDQYDKRTINEGGSPGLGGSFKGNRVKESLVILITPVMTEGI